MAKHTKIMKGHKGGHKKKGRKGRGRKRGRK